MHAKSLAMCIEKELAMMVSCTVLSWIETHKEEERRLG